MVDYTTRVMFSLNCPKQQPWSAFKPPAANDVEEYGRFIAERNQRVAAMMRILEKQGFIFKYIKGTICADSSEIEGQAVKKLLRTNGFADYEYQIYLEYYRRWGIL